MKAVICSGYGSPDVFQLAEVSKPVPRDNEILIRIKATSVSSGDVRIRKADPFAVRFVFGLTKPKNPILGFVVAGTIEDVGRDVTLFKAGDAVLGTTGMTFGAYAEYITLPENGAVVVKPDAMTFAEAAAIPFGGNSSLCFLRKANIQNGQKILIYGASGALGTSAVQLARHFGAEVTGVCSGANAELVRSLGADRIIDYTKEDFTESGEKYDVIFDTIGESPFSGCIKSLKQNGRYVRAVHTSPSAIARGIWTSVTTGKKVIGGGVTEKVEDLNFLKDLFERGQLRSTIDRTYPFEQIADAHRYVETGRKKGNVVITLDPEIES